MSDNPADPDSPMTADQRYRAAALARRREEMQERVPSAPGVEREVKKSRSYAIEMDRFQLQIGAEHGITALELSEHIAACAELAAEHIGEIIIRDDHTVIDLPAGMPKELLRMLKREQLNGVALRITRLGAAPGTVSAAKPDKRRYRR